ncbi:MAG: serine/threonine-protein kinase [Myxococcota bacterium]
MSVDDIPPLGAPPEDLETRRLRAKTAQALFGDQAPDVMKIGRFQLRSQLGSGGQGAVFVADDPKLGRRVALKRLTTAHAEHRERMHREARALAKVDHPNVVSVYEVDEDETGRTFLVMALVEGLPLDRWLREQPRPWAEVVELMCTVGDGLAAIHAAGLVHRDVKPQNIVVGKDGKATLVDLGIAVQGETLGVAKVPTAGTVGYIAPEHYDGQADPRSDQFGFCVTLWEALHGVRPPWSVTLSQAPSLHSSSFGSSPSNAHSPGPETDEEPLDPSQSSGVRDKLPRRLPGVLGRGLRHEPDERYDDMASLVAALRELLPRPRRSLWALGGLLAAGIVIGASFFFVPDPCDDSTSVGAVWGEDVQHSVRDAFLGAGANDGEQIFATVDRMMGAASSSLSDRWSDACELPRRSSARLVALAEVRSAQAALSAITAELPLVEGSNQSELPVRLARTLSRFQVLGNRDTCEQTEVLLEATEQMQQINRVSRRAEARWLAGDYDSALAALGTEAEPLAEGETLGPVRTRLLFERGRRALESQRFDEAISTLEQARSSAETLGCDGLGARVLALLAKAELLASNDSTERAGYTSQEALEKVERIDAAGPRRAEALKSRGLYLQRRRNYADAIEHYHRALEILRAQQPPDVIGITDTLLNLAVSQARQGDPGAAIETLHGAIEQRETLLWPEHPSLYKFHASLSYRYLDLDQPVASERALARALALATAGLGEGSSRVATLHIAMARVLTLQHRFEEALGHATQADTIFRTKFGDDDLHRLDSLEAMGQVCNSAGWFQQAIPPLQQALEIQALQSEPDARRLAIGRAKLARAYVRGEEHEKALVLYEQVDRALADPIVRADPFVPDMLMGWGQSLVSVGRFAEAIAPLRESVERWSNRGDNPERLAHARWWLAQALCVTDAAQAESQAREALAYFERSEASGADRMRSEIRSWLEHQCLEDHRDDQQEEHR